LKKQSLDLFDPNGAKPDTILKRITPDANISTYSPLYGSYSKISGAM